MWMYVLYVNVMNGVTESFVLIYKIIGVKDEREENTVFSLEDIYSHK